MLLNRNRSETHFSSSYERLICSEELGSSPSNAHAYRLYIFNEPARFSSSRHPLLANLAAISEAFDYHTGFEDLSTSKGFR
jgi:hypothetical protein